MMYIEVQSVSEPVDLRPRFGDKLQPKQELDMVYGSETDSEGVWARVRAPDGVLLHVLVHKMIRVSAPISLLVVHNAFTTCTINVI